MGDFVKSIGAGISGVMNIVGANRREGEYEGALRTIDSKYRKGLGTLYEQYGMAQDQMRPYADAGPEAMAYLRSALYGGEQSYADPRYHQLTDYDLNQLNAENIQNQRAQYINTEKGRLTKGQKAELRQSLGLGRKQKLSGEEKQKALAEYQAKGLNPIEVYDKGKTYYRGPNGEIIEASEIPQLKAKFDPQESEAYKIQKERGLADLDRLLRMNGRGNSTYGTRENSRFLEDLNASESDRQLARLAQLLGIGGTASSNIANSQMGLGNNLGTLYQNWASKKATAKQALGDVKFAKWSQMAEDNMNVANHLGNGVNSMMSGFMSNGGSSSNSGYNVDMSGGGGGGGGGGGMSFLSNSNGAWGQGGYYR